MKSLQSKKGSVTVFLMIFFVSLFSGLIIFVKQSEKIGIKGSVEALGQVWAQSILAEYDTNLLKEYGIFGYKGFPKAVEKKVNFYANQSFQGKSYIDYDGSFVYGETYSFRRPSVMKRQIIEEGKFCSLNYGKINNEPENESETNRYIKNEAILNYLPSRQDINEEIGKGSPGDILFILAYIDTYFANGCKGSSSRGYFNNEAEYIIAGKADDSRNLSSVRNKIILMREPINYLYLQKDKEKLEAVQVASAIITPGPESVATAQAILSSWALLESVNDYKLLINGYKVPEFKNKETWATDLDSVLNNKESGFVYTGVNKGKSYKDYLHFFIAGLNQEKVILRIMDLIQINMRFLYYDDFLLSEYNGGVKGDLYVNGETYQINKEY